MAETTPVLSDDEIAAITARAEKATPGPWDVQRQDEDDGDIVWEVWNDKVLRVLKISGKWDSSNRRARPDAAFIAASRTDIPKLIASHASLKAEVERLREALDAARSFVDATSILDQIDEALKTGENTP